METQLIQLDFDEPKHTAPDHPDVLEMSQAQPIALEAHEPKMTTLHLSNSLKELEMQPMPFEGIRPERSIRDHLVTAFYVSVNSLATIAIVFLSKIVFSDPQLGNCQISYAAWHMVATASILGLCVLPLIGYFTPIRLPLRQILPICICFTGFLVFQNLSLKYNPIGFYQLMKIMTTPTVAALSFILFRRKISMTRLVAVLATCIGVAMTCSGDMSSNPLGTILAVLSFSITACYQVLVGKSLESQQISPPQLLLNQASVAALMLGALIPLIDRVPNVESIEPRVMFAALLSGIVAAIINLSQFAVIARTSALTWNMLSLVKTMAILAISWFIDGKLLALHDFLGVLFAFSGSWVYAVFKADT